VAKVEFLVDGVKIGEDTSEPYSFDWASPTLGAHVLLAIATDNQGASQNSAPASVTVYDSLGTPFAQITSPADGTVVEGPTNMLVTAYASAVAGVTNVQFRANGTAIGDDATSPYSVIWAAPFGSNALSAVAFDSNGRRGTSAVVGIVITIHPQTPSPEDCLAGSRSGGRRHQSDDHRGDLQ